VRLVDFDTKRVGGVLNVKVGAYSKDEVVEMSR
jgi:hypothetical protein